VGSIFRIFIQELHVTEDFIAKVNIFNSILTLFYLVLSCFNVLFTSAFNLIPKQSSIFKPNGFTAEFTRLA
jgi:hypothetical protein